MNIRDVLRYGHQTFRQPLFGLSDAAWEQPGAVGEWSVKEIVAHIASFEQLLVAILEHLLDGENAPLVARFAADPERFNVDEVNARRHLSPADTFAEYDRAHRRVMALLERLPAEQLEENGIFPWYGEQYDLEDFLVYTFYGHKREHAAHIGLYRDRLEQRQESDRSQSEEAPPEPFLGASDNRPDWSFATRLWRPARAAVAAGYPAAA